MKIRAKLILGFLLNISIALGVGFYFVLAINGLSNIVSTNIPNSIQNISNQSYLNSLAESIRYYDEFLTQSARNYAFTGDKKWKDRYSSVVADLAAKIRAAQDNGDVVEKSFFSTVAEANTALVKLETQSFALVEAGKGKEAVALLDSQEYQDQKLIYSGALDKYLLERGAEYQNTLSVSTKAISDSKIQIENYISQTLYIFIVAVIISLILSILIVLFFSGLIVNPLKSLIYEVKAAAEGNSSGKVEVNSGDELEDLADSVNKMIKSISDGKENVEKKIEERTKELEELNKYMVGREVKMVELKNKINKFERNREK